MCDNKSLVLLDMVSFADTLKNSLTDGFQALPLLLMGFEFFFGTLTSNIGLLYLLVGHFLLVPLLGYFLNERQWWNLAKKETISRFVFVLVAIVSMTGLFGYKAFSITEDLTNAQIEANRNLTDEQKKDIESKKWVAFGLSFGLFALLSFVTGKMNMAPGDVLNIPRWTSAGQSSSTAQGSAECSLIPLKEGDVPNYWNSPSLWVIHMVFLGSFLLTNAVAVFNLPVPNLATSAAGEEGLKERQDRLNSRVANRKRIAVFIMLMVVLVFGGFLAIRYMKTACEDTIFYNIIPLFIVAWIGSSWYDLVYKKCGVNPPDVLGIVSGIIPPELLDTPMVCVGGESNFT